MIKVTFIVKRELFIENILTFSVSIHYPLLNFNESIITDYSQFTGIYALVYS